MEMNPAKIQLLIGVLAGGRSRGMGADKALLRVEGDTLLERVVHTALATGYPVAVSGREQMEEWPFQGVQFVPDEIPFRGPLHGIARLLERFRTPVVAVGCDMPLITVEALEWLIGVAPRDMREDGLATRDAEGGIQPLFSIYTPQVLPLIGRRCSAGDCSVRSVIAAGRFGEIAIPPEYEQDLLSIDTPEEYEDLKRLLSAFRRDARSI